MAKSVLKTNDPPPEAEKMEVVNLLKQFMMEMTQWELSCVEQLKDLDLESDELTVKEKRFLSDLKNIYRKYCTPKKRKYTRLGSYGIPPNYDPSIEKIVDVVLDDPNKIIVYSQREFGIRTQYKYIVLRSNQKWLIDSRQRLDENGRWRNVVL